MIFSIIFKLFKSLTKCFCRHRFITMKKMYILWCYWMCSSWVIVSWHSGLLGEGLFYLSKSNYNLLSTRTVCYTASFLVLVVHLYESFSFIIAFRAVHIYFVKSCISCFLVSSYSGRERSEILEGRVMPFSIHCGHISIQNTILVCHLG